MNANNLELLIDNIDCDLFATRELLPFYETENGVEIVKGFSPDEVVNLTFDIIYNEYNFDAFGRAVLYNPYDFFKSDIITKDELRTGLVEYLKRAGVIS